MSLLDDTLAAYRAVLTTFRLPEMDKAHLDRGAPEHLRDEGALMEALRRFAPRQGWLCFQSAVHAFDGGALPEAAPHWGRILNGECVNAAGHSIRIRPDGAGGWYVDEFRPGAGEECLADTVRLVRRDAPGHLLYRRYWRHDEFHGVHQFAACFIGYSEEEQK